MFVYHTPIKVAEKPEIHFCLNYNSEFGQECGVTGANMEKMKLHFEDSLIIIELCTVAGMIYSFKNTFEVKCAIFRYSGENFGCCL